LYKFWTIDSAVKRCRSVHYDRGWHFWCCQPGLSKIQQNV